MKLVAASFKTHDFGEVSSHENFDIQSKTSIILLIMIVDVQTIDEQTSCLSAEIFELKKMLEQKDLQIASLMNRLETNAASKANKKATTFSVLSA